MGRRKKKIFKKNNYKLNKKIFKELNFRMINNGVLYNSIKVKNKKMIANHTLIDNAIKDYHNHNKDALAFWRSFFNRYAFYFQGKREILENLIERLKKQGKKQNKELIKELELNLKNIAEKIDEIISILGEINSEYRCNLIQEKIKKKH